MTIEEIKSCLEMGNHILFSKYEWLDDINDEFRIYSGDFEEMLVRHYNGEYTLINNTYVHHLDCSYSYVDTYQLTLTDKEWYDIADMCIEWKNKFRRTEY